MKKALVVLFLYVFGMCSMVPNAFAQVQQSNKQFRLKPGEQMGKYIVRHEKGRLGIWNTDDEKWIVKPNRRYSQFRFIDSHIAFVKGAGYEKWEDGSYVLGWGYVYFDPESKNPIQEFILPKYDKIGPRGIGGPYTLAIYKGDKEIRRGSWWDDEAEFNAGVKWGLMNGKGEEIMPFSYDSIQFKPYCLVAYQNGLCGLFSREGKQIIPVKYSWISGIIKDNEQVLGILACNQEGKCGVIDTLDNVVVPFQYDSIADFEPDEELFKIAKVDIDKVGKHLVQVKLGDKYGLLNYKNKLVAPVQYNTSRELNTQALLYPQSSFFYYINERVLYMVSNKGEFETTAEYEVRKNSQELQEAYVQKQMPHADKDFINWTLKNIKSPFVYYLIRYNADNEIYEFVNYATPRQTYYLSIPRSEAESFKQHFDEIKADAIPSSKCFIENDAISIAEVTFTMPDGKVYQYLNPACKGNKWPLEITKTKIVQIDETQTDNTLYK
jgi:hypothetical protein